MSVNSQYENSKIYRSDEPITYYKIVYTIESQTRVMQVKAATAFLALKEFERKVLPHRLEVCLIDTIDAIPVVIKRHLKRDRLKNAV